MDPKDTSCFGAIYESAKFPSLDPNHRPPHYVIAFRGSINKPGNREQDFKLNLQVFINNLEKSSRFQIAMQSVIQIVQTVGPGNIWLAGHSLGSSIALLIGKQMVKSGIHLETYLFNPPFGSPHIERIKNEKVKLGLRFANSVITAGLAAASNSVNKDKGDPFTVLAAWVPYLFINPSDPICSEYVGYFKHREDMEAIGAGKIGRLATKHSIGSIFSIGKKECEAVHLIPSAYLSINASHSQSFKEAHGIHQWWRPDLQLIYKYYQYKH